MRGWRIAIVVAVALAAPPAAAGAAPKPGTLVERPVKSQAPHHRQVLESLVRVYDPLPEGTAEHPAACDWIQYLRFRSADGPEKARRADAVLVIMPGFLAGASSFDPVARNTVRRAALDGRHIEYWALDRRANCLEDNRGIKAAARAGDPSVAFDYYWGGKPVNGRTFGGFVPPEDAQFLNDFGLERTMEDWYEVLRTGIRGQRTRARKVICGGHSLGGPLTAAFSSWDFDGDPETTKDAGYMQCAGLVGLDTDVSLSGSGGGGPGVGDFSGLAAESGASPYVNAPPLTPETIEVPTVFGVGAYYQPDSTDMLAELPHSTNLDFSQRVLFSRDAAHFASNDPDIRDFTITNETALAGILDDNSASIFFLRASLGQTLGGPLVDKNFPTPGGGFLALPEDPATPVYRWESYRQVGLPGHELPLNDEGVPYTGREGEVTDMRQFARSFFEAPANFTEQYFPTRILTEAATAGNGGFPTLYDGPSLRPLLQIQAGDSDDNSAPDEGPPTEGEPPNDREHSAEIVIPGYNHLDVGTAAWRQNDGRPEPTSAALAEFAHAAVGAAHAH